AAETCNSLDDNCDGSIDEGVQTTYFKDLDADTYGDLQTTTAACTAPSGFVTDSRDCDDTKSSVHPGATEVCDGVDQDCDGTVDNGLPLPLYADTDADTYGDASATAQVACTAPVGTVADHTDCNDAVATVPPGAAELCNDIDDDCNGQVDDAAI